jgi:hypothetical protein
MPIDYARDEIIRRREDTVRKLGYRLAAARRDGDRDRTDAIQRELETARLDLQTALRLP